MRAWLRRLGFRWRRRLWGIEYAIYLEPGGSIKLTPPPLDGTVFRVTYRYGSSLAGPEKRELYTRLRPNDTDLLLGRVKTRSALVEIEL
jgi:hypothetical protein